MGSRGEEDMQQGSAARLRLADHTVPTLCTDKLGSGTDCAEPWLNQITLTVQTKKQRSSLPAR